MGGLLFVSQGILDTWSGQGKIDFSGNDMTVLSGPGKGRSYRLESAVRILRVAGGDSDPNGLLHKVKGEMALRQLGAEILGDSVVLGEVAYEVEPGFLADSSALQAAAASPVDPVRAAAPPPAEGREDGPPAAASPSSPQAQEDRRTEAEALARYLLENLS